MMFGLSRGAKSKINDIRSTTADALSDLINDSQQIKDTGEEFENRKRVLFLLV